MMLGEGSRLSPRKRVLAALLGCAILVVYVAWNSLVKLELSPEKVSECGKFPMAVTVRWDVSRLAIKSIRLEVNNLGGRRKLWQIAGSRGTEQTGKWVRDGYTVSLVWRGVVLKKATITTEPCVKGRRKSTV
jgi:hypothetical protein